MNLNEKIENWVYEAKNGKKGYLLFASDKNNSAYMFKGKKPYELESLSIFVLQGNKLTYSYVAGQSNDKPYIIIKNSNKMLLMNAGKNVRTFGDMSGDMKSDSIEAVIIMYTTSYSANIIIATNRSEVINYLESVDYKNYEAFEQLSELMNNKTEIDNKIERKDYNEEVRLNLGTIE